jgi:hypothetical protein
MKTVYPKDEQSAHHANALKATPSPSSLSTDAAAYVCSPHFIVGAQPALTPSFILDETEAGDESHAPSADVEEASPPDRVDEETDDVVAAFTACLHNSSSTPHPIISPLLHQPPVELRRRPFVASVPAVTDPLSSESTGQALPAMGLALPAAGESVVGLVGSVFLPAACPEQSRGSEALVTAVLTPPPPPPVEVVAPVALKTPKGGKAGAKVTKGK